MKEKNYKMFVAIINGNETHFEADMNAHMYEDSSVLKMIERIIRESGMKTNRKNPQAIKIKIDAIKIKDGKQVRSTYRAFEIIPPLERMTEEEFEEEQEEILKEVPQEFHSVFKAMARDSSDSYGYEGIIGYLKGIISDLSPSINAFAQRISKAI